MHATSLSLHETSSSAAHWLRHLIWLTCPIANSVCGVQCGAHVGKLERTLLTEVIEATSNHDLGLAREDAVTSYLNGLKSSGAKVEKLRKDLLIEIMKQPYQASTGILISLLEESNRRLTQPAMVLMKLKDPNQELMHQVKDFNLCLL